MIDSADKLTHMLPVSAPLRLHFLSEEAGAARMFIADLAQDLLGDWIVTLSWTGKAASRGGGRVTVVSDQEAGFELLQKIARKKEKSGYRLI